MGLSKLREMLRKMVDVAAILVFILAALALLLAIGNELGLVWFRFY